MRQIIAGLAVSGLMVCGAGLVLAGTNPPGIDEPLKTGLTAPGDVAVVIGNEDYYKIADVPYAKADAAAFETFLTYTRGVPLDRIRSLRDVSKEEMLAAVQEMAAKKPTGIFWIYYAGHGMGDPNSADAKAPDRLLLGGDASGGAAQLASGGASVKALQAAAAAGGGQVVMVVDACYNGGTRADTGEGTGLTGGARIAVPESLVTQAGVIEWAASAPTQLALPLASVGHGAFTYLAIGALRGWADGERSGSRDGTVTLEEAQTYVQRQFSVMQLTSQQPQVSGGAALSVALSGKAGARLETGPPPEVVRGLAAGGAPVKAPPATVTASTTAPATVTASTTQARPWTAADDAVIAGMIEAEKSRIVDTVREAQEAEVPQIVAVRRQSVAEEWEELKAVFGDPAEASAAGIAAVEQKIAEWKQDVARPAARRATLMGSVSWNGRTQQLSGTMEVPGQAVPVSHPETVRAAEAWLAAARGAQPVAPAMTFAEEKCTRGLLGPEQWVYTQAEAGWNGNGDKAREEAVARAKAEALAALRQKICAGFSAADCDAVQKYVYDRHVYDDKARLACVVAGIRPEYVQLLRLR